MARCLGQRRRLLLDTSALASERKRDDRQLMKARIRGVEVELVGRPLPGLLVEAAYGHIDARYLDVGRVPGISTATRFARTPSHSATASIGYEVPTPWGTAGMHANVSYRSKEQFQLVARPHGYALVGARLLLSGNPDGWSVALFGINLTGARYRTAGRGVASVDGIAFSSIAMPRQLGMEVRFGF